MKLLFLFLGGLLGAQEVAPGAPDAPPSASTTTSTPIPAAVPEDPMTLFIKGRALGHVGDDPKNPHRRLVQRTLMPSEMLPAYGVILTFDDQLLPLAEGDSSALEVAQDLSACHARAIFFANVPQNSTRILNSLLRTDDPEASVRKLLLKRKPEFMKAVRDLLKIKDGERNVCDVHNHTAFHQNMKSMKPGSDRFKVCIEGIRFIEECLDEAYAAERPGVVRTRYFRFPFLAAPKYTSTRKALDAVFTELGLVALGETQDSKDVLNFSPDLAYEAMKAAKTNRRYNPTLKAHGETEQPIALFHTRSWSRIKSGILKAINEKEAIATPSKNDFSEEATNPGALPENDE